MRSSRIAVITTGLALIATTAFAGEASLESAGAAGGTIRYVSHQQGVVILQDRLGRLLLPRDLLLGIDGSGREAQRLAV